VKKHWQCLKTDRELAELQQGKILGELELIRLAYVGAEPLNTHLNAIEGFAEVALNCLRSEESL